MTSKRQSMMSNASKLALFAFACTLLVVIVNFFTEDKIAEQIQRQLVKSTNEVLNPELAASSYQQQCYVAVNEPLLGNAKQQTVRVISQNQQAQALVYQTTAPDGYSGAIQLLVGVNSDGSISGVRVVQHNETPGLGDKIETRKSDWIYQFNQQRLVADDDSRWAVKKDGGQFDAFTGATITPRAVIKAVKNVLIYHKANQQQIIQSASDC
jgi:electron transport complex protein RnfG